MKTILIFSDSDEDMYKLDLYKKAPDMHSVITEWEELFRKVYKYEELTEEQSNLIERLRREYYTIRNQYNID